MIGAIAASRAEYAASLAMSPLPADTSATPKESFRRDFCAETNDSCRCTVRPVPRTVWRETILWGGVTLPSNPTRSPSALSGILISPIYLESTASASPCRAMPSAASHLWLRRQESARSPKPVPYSVEGPTTDVVNTAFPAGSSPYRYQLNPCTIESLV